MLLYPEQLLRVDRTYKPDLQTRKPYYLSNSHRPTHFGTAENIRFGCAMVPAISTPGSNAYRRQASRARDRCLIILVARLGGACSGFIFVSCALLAAAAVKSLKSWLFWVGPRSFAWFSLKLWIAMGDLIRYLGLHYARPTVYQPDSNLETRVVFRLW